MPLLLCLPACGGSSGGDSDVAAVTDTAAPPKEELPLVTSQERYTEADFLAKVEADSDLVFLWDKLQKQGYTKFLDVGVTEDEDGVKVIWGEAFGDGLPVQGLLRHCKGDDCVSVLWSFVGDDLVWRGKDGLEVEPRGIGLPVLLKSLEGHAYDNPTHVWKAAVDELPTDLPDIDVTKRRFFLLNSFGPLWANGTLDTSTLETLAKDSGAFDQVQHKQYARTGDVDFAMAQSHPFDALVWLTQAVREEAKTGKVYKPVGLTANAGLFGDKTVDRDHLGYMLSANPLQGPGLMVLAGCETMGDGNGGGELDKSLPTDLDNKARVLVGFQKCGDARDVLQATTLFVDAYLGGQTLGDALASANAYLTSQSSDLVMKTLPSADLASVYLKDVSAFWDQYTDDGVPAASFFNANILIINQCTDKSGKEYQQDESFTSAWSKEISWQGPFFAGARKNPGNFVDLEISGALLAIREGAHFFFAVKGSLGPKVQETLIYGNAVVKKIVVDKEKPDEFTIQFSGEGRASSFVNENGDTCVMQPPLLVSSTGEPSTFKLPVTWKAPAAEGGNP
jgi:hypothetical protein